jgi:hypothetical protein
MSSRTSASVSVEVKPSVNSPVEFRSEIYHDIESNDDSLSVEEKNRQSTYEKICRNFALNFTADFFGKILRAKSLKS